MTYLWSQNFVFFASIIILFLMHMAWGHEVASSIPMVVHFFFLDFFWIFFPEFFFGFFFWKCQKYSFATRAHTWTLLLRQPARFLLFSWCYNNVYKKEYYMSIFSEPVDTPFNFCKRRSPITLGLEKTIMPRIDCITTERANNHTTLALSRKIKILPRLPCWKSGLWCEKTD